MAQTVRFTELLKVGKKPKFYLPLADPRTDKSFTKAEREHRIVSLKQTPTGTQKDHGVIGVLREKHVTYLIFPESLSRFAGKRVVGIKYDQLDDADTLTPPDTHGPIKSKSKALIPRKTEPPKLVTAPKRFVAILRLTAVKDVEQNVHATTRKHAEAQAIQTAREAMDLADAKISIRVIELREVGD